MGRKRGILLAIALLIVLALASWKFWPRPREPVYNGRTLSAWIQRLPAAGDGTRGVEYRPLIEQKSADELEAEAALQHFGTNALPYLMAEMRTQDRGLAERIAEFKDLCRKLYARLFSHQMPSPQYNAFRSTAEKRHWNAARGLNALGPLARPVLPELVATLNGGNLFTCPDAAYALGNLGPEGVAALRHCMTNVTGGDWPQICAIWAAGQNASNCQSSVPELLTSLHDKDSNVRMATTWALGRIRTEPELEAPALAANLSDTDSNVRSLTDQALREYGLKSLSAQSLLEYLDDSWPHVRMAATNALRVLFPDEAAKAGITEK
jgi:HEAT repeats